ncbi:MAG: right-handed parallel beta-helix repeat-containing protein, partial [bacterium]|nr:right-handed parallel beta-helix repeat-containing protein [bacterium]
MMDRSGFLNPRFFCTRLLLSFLFLFPVFFLFFSASLYPESFYVDDGGSDGNDGTNSTLPFRTIQRAANAMMPLSQSSTCYIMPGTYQEKVTICSNKNGGYMVFIGMSNAKPLLQGALLTNSGFLITNTSRVILNNIIIKQFNRYAVSIGGSSRSNRILNCFLYSNAVFGVFLHTDLSDDNEIRANTAWGWNQDYGINIMDADRNLVRSNIVYKCRDSGGGIRLHGTAVSNIISRNQMYSNKQYGINLEDNTVNQNSVLTNIIRANSGTGLNLSAADKNLVRGNLICKNSNEGVYFINQCVSNIIENNIICSNSGDGVYLYIGGSSPRNNFILNNDIFGPDQNIGVHFWAASLNTIKGNKLRKHESDGIY